MKCNNCGNELNENDKFCCRCGTPIGQGMASNMNTQGDMGSQPTVQQEAGGYNGYPNYGQPMQQNYGNYQNYNNPKKSGSGAIVAVIIAIVVVILGSVVGGIVVFNKINEVSEKSGKTVAKNKDNKSDVEDEEVAKTGQATYTTVQEGFVYEIPCNLQAETVEGGFVIADEENGWATSVSVYEQSYDALKLNKQGIESELAKYGYTVGNQEDKLFAGKEFITYETVKDGRNILITMTKLDFSTVCELHLQNNDNTYDYAAMETLGGIISTAKKSEQTMNMKADGEDKLDLGKSVKTTKKKK